MPTPFEEALANLMPSDQAHVRLRLEQWAGETSLGARIPANLRAERFLPPKPCMESLLRVIASHVGAPPAELQEAYRKACHDFALRGGRVTLAPLPQVLGRAVDKSVWVNHLISNHLSLFSNCRHFVREFVDRLVNDPAYVIGYPENQCLSSRFAAWVTWSDGSPDPFAFCSTDRADEVRASLGLVSKRKGRSPFLLLLVYDRPSDGELFRPTVADAATYPFFRQPLQEQGDHHGWTLPWPEEEVHSLLPGAMPQSRPEALHKPWRLSLLRLPLRCRS